MKRRRETKKDTRAEQPDVRCTRHGGSPLLTADPYERLHRGLEAAILIVEEARISAAIADVPNDLHLAVDHLQQTQVRAALLVVYGREAVRRAKSGPRVPAPPKPPKTKPRARRA